jgi:hypothetical protein
MFGTALRRLNCHRGMCGLNLPDGYYCGSRRSGWVRLAERRLPALAAAEVDVDASADTDDCGGVLTGRYERGEAR